MALHSVNRRLLVNILDKAQSGGQLSYQDTLFLLSLEDDEAIKKVMAAARKIRDKYFGNNIFVYGFIYFSTFCQNHCSFCYYRKTNQLSPRYRKSLEEIVDIAVRLAESGIHLIDLTMGEDPEIIRAGKFEILFEMIMRVKDATGLPVMISPGVVPVEVLEKFSNLGVDWYALYQETHNQVLYKKLRVGQSFRERADRRAAALDYGMLVEDGMLLGVGETTGDRAASILNMKDQGVQQARVMSLVPQAQTPMASRKAIPRVQEALSIAVMRIIMPDKLIPASLDVDGIKGLKMRLEAGANVVTSIIPPSASLAGVSQSTLDIDEGLRTVPEVKKILSGMGLRVADSGDYIKWIAGLKAKRVNWGDDCSEGGYCGGTASGFGSSLPGPAGWVGDGTN